MIYLSAHNASQPHSQADWRPKQDTNDSRFLQYIN